MNKQEQVFPGRFDSIPTICDCVVEAAEAAGLPQKEVFHIQLAVDEACTNVVEHAYGGEDQGELYVSCEIDPDQRLFVVRIKDSGKPFDPDSIPEPNLTHDLHNLQVGGLGLHFMHKIMDRVEFGCRDGWNELVMSKSLDAGPAVSGEGPVWQQPLFEGVWLVGVRGRLDHILVPHFETVLRDLQANGHHQLVVTFEEATYINSGGLRALVSAWRSAREHQGDVYVCALNDRLVEIFEMAGFDRIFQIFATPADAATAILQSE